MADHTRTVAFSGTGTLSLTRTARTVAFGGTGTLTVSAPTRTLLFGGTGTLSFTRTATTIAFGGEGFLDIASPPGLHFTGTGELVLDGRAVVFVPNTAPTLGEGIEQTGGFVMNGHATLTIVPELSEPDATWEDEILVLETGTVHETDYEADDTDPDMEIEPTTVDYLEEEFALDVDEPDEEVVE